MKYKFTRNDGIEFLLSSVAGSYYEFNKEQLHSKFGKIYMSPDQIEELDKLCGNLHLAIFAFKFRTKGQPYNRYNLLQNIAYSILTKNVIKIEKLED